MLGILLDTKHTQDGVDLYFEGLSPQVYDSYENTKRDAEVISQEECQNLIFGEIRRTIKTPNYYQLNY